jgi:DNA-binding GntR family transcriptional regulator
MTERSRREHALMCDLLDDRDADGLAVLMRDHLTGSLEYVRQSESAELAATAKQQEASS